MRYPTNKITPPLMMCQGAVPSESKFAITVKTSTKQARTTQFCIARPHRYFARHTARGLLSVIQAGEMGIP